MAITTVDGAIAGMQPPRVFAKAATGTMVAGRPWSLWALAGNPGAGGFNGTLAGVTCDNTTAGAVPFTNPVSGNSYLARLAASATIAGQLILCDRLWHNGGFTITTTGAQTVNSASLPARDANASTNGEGVYCGIEVSAACGAAAPAPTLTYTNSGGTGSRSAGLVFPTANSPAAGSFFPFGLQAGDAGIRSIQSLTLGTSWVSGTINLVMYREIARLELAGAYTPNAIDILTSGFTRIMDSSCLFCLFIPSTTTTTNVSGSIVWTQG